MKDLDFFNRLIHNIDIHVKSYNDIEHDHSWVESGIKTDYDLWLILSGEIRLTIQGLKMTARCNDLVLLYPQMLYQAECITEDCSFLYIHFDFKIGNNLRGLDEMPLAGVIPESAAKSEISSFLQSYRSYQENKPLSLLVMKGYFTVLLAKVIVYQFTRDDALADKQESIALVRLHPVFEHVSNHIRTHIPIGDLAEIMGMTPKYFITFFKSKVGITPGKYITQIKMEKALNMINENKLSIKEIADFLGYPDQYTFSKVFKKHYKVSPSKYSFIDSKPFRE